MHKDLKPNVIIMKNNLYAQIFVVYLRYLLGFAFVFASIVKIEGLRFTSESGAENPINSAWHYFETMYQSGLYWRFIGVGQFVAGALLLTQRYAKLGVITYLPIIANVFIITISYNFNGTPVITGLMLLATLFLIYWDWNIFKVLVNQKPKLETKNRLEHEKIWQITGLFFLVLTPVLKFITSPVVFFILLVGIGFVALIIGLKRNNTKLTLKRRI